VWSGSAFTHGLDAREARFLGRWPSGALLDQLRFPGVFPIALLGESWILSHCQFSTDSKGPGSRFPGLLHFLGVSESRGMPDE